MRTQLRTKGIHHITAVASSAVENLDFYRNVLGLRLVKKTVNFDDPYTYHFYYGVSNGTPGTILTFFPWEQMTRGRHGAGMVTTVSFAVPLGSLAYWAERLTERRIDIASEQRFDESLLRFTDPHGLYLELIETNIPRLNAHVEPSPVPLQHAIIGFHSATAVLHPSSDPRGMLLDGLGMSLLAREGKRYRYRLHGDSTVGTTYDVVLDDRTAPGIAGGGTVHHIAFRARNDQEQLAWQQHLRDMGFAVTPVRDRNYFRSIYFRTQGGVLFEIATDPPGFAVDEPLERLGQSLKLPPQYEPMRADIEAHLPALGNDDFKHLFIHSETSADDGRTLVTLHGTGGNEHSLVELAGRTSGGASILSPRGKVLENGMPRFFERLADGVFDDAEVIRRANQLADFVLKTVPQYGRDVENLVGLGYSNGANIAAAILLLRPEVFCGAVLIRPMLPLQPRVLPDLTGKPVLILQGLRDTVISSHSTRELIDLLKQSGACVEVAAFEAGHEITPSDLETASRWFNETGSGNRQKTCAELTASLS